MKRFFGFKFLMLLSVALFFNALTMNAQSDWFVADFGNEGLDSRASNVIIGSGSIINLGVGEPAPLGSGLLIMTVAGVGYVAMRRRRSVRKGATLLLAFAMLLGMTQCKKNLNDAATNVVNITLSVDNGSRAIVDPTGHTDPDYATVDFENGDILYVGYNKQYVGYLEYANDQFSGNVTISETVADERLYFYFMGGKGYNPTIVGNTISVDISDQGVVDLAGGTHRYPIISFGASYECYSPSLKNYSTQLMNKCAMIKFNVVKPAGYDQAGTCIVGKNNRVTVNLNPASNEDDGFSYNKVNGGAITIDSKIGDVWAILLPQDATEAAEAFSVRRKGTQPAMPAIHANDYISEAITLNLNTEFAPTGVVANKADALYKIADDKFVLFSKANLKATTTDSWATWTWGFKDTQYEKEIEGDVGNDYSARTSVSLFGWATSGYYGSIHPNTTYKITQSDFGPKADLTGINAKYDWGYNIITDNNAYKQWRSLSWAEWQYLFANNPHKDSKIITAEGHIDGTVLLPYGHSASEINPYSAGYTVEQWATAETTLGAIFMPNAGRRSNGSIPYNTIHISNDCEIWTTTFDAESPTQYAKTADFNYYGNLVTHSYSRAQGFFVRLVCE